MKLKHEAAFRSGDRIVARNLLEAVDALPRKWRIHWVPPVGKLRFGTLVFPAHPAGWRVTAPTCDLRIGGHIFACGCDWFPTYAEAVGYVGDVIDERRRDQLAAIQDGGAGR